MDQRTLTPEAVEKSLLDKSGVKVKAWVFSGSGTLDIYGIKPTMAQVERGLTTAYTEGTISGSSHEDWSTATVWIGRKDYPPTAEQIAYGLSHPDFNVRLAWATRNDFVPTDDQISAGLSDEDHFLAKEWMDRKGITFNDRHLDIMISKFYFDDEDRPLNDPRSDVIIQVFIDHNVSLNQSQIERVTATSYYSRSREARAFIRTQIAELCGADAIGNKSVVRKHRL